MGFVYQENKSDPDAAISAYQTAYVLTPEDIDIYVNLGSAFYDKEDLPIIMKLMKGNIDSIIYGLISTYILSIVVDKVMYGIDAGKTNGNSLCGNRFYFCNYW